MKKNLKKLIKDKYKLSEKEYYKFILNFLSNDSIRILKGKLARNYALNINILLSLDLIVKKLSNYYIKDNIINLVKNKKVNSFIIYFDGIMNAYGCVNINYFNYKYIDLVLLIRNDIKHNDKYIYKDILVPFNNYPLKKYTKEDIILLSNNLYYTKLESYKLLQKFVSLDEYILNDLIVNIYISIYQLKYSNIEKLFDKYINNLNLFNNIEIKVIKFYLRKIVYNIPLWYYGGYTMNEIMDN